MKWVDAETLNRKLREPGGREKSAAGQSRIQGIKKEHLPWPSEF
jgi:hypothetical protein